MDMSSKFISSISSQSVDDTKVCIVQIINLLSERYPYIKSQVMNEQIIYDKLNHIFLIIGKILDIEFDDLNINVVDQVYTRTFNKTSFRKILDIIAENDVHQNVKIGKKKFSCSYHTEPLIDHLIYASIITGIHAINDNQNEKIILMSCITALLHDIGKPACIHAFGKHLGYPFHGENGCAMILRAFNDNFLEYFTLDEYLAIARCVAVHMCSYHVADYTTERNLHRASSIFHETSQCKILLKYLSYGDTFGKFPESIHDDSTEDFINSRDLWNEQICKQNELDFKNFTICVNGRSNSGKSTIVNIIAKWFQEFNISYEIISRDVVLCNIVYNMFQDQLDFKLQSDSRPTGIQYAACYELYKQHQLGHKVNSEMKTLIRNSIKTNIITIIDTQATMFPNVDNIFPAEITNTIRVSIVSMINFMTNINDKNGVSLNTQLEMTGKISSISPMDYSGVDLIGMQAESSNNSDPSPFAYSNVFPVVATLKYQNSNTMGLSMFFDYMKKMVKQIEDTNPERFIDTSLMHIGDYIRYYANKFNDFDKLCEHFRMMCYTASAPPDIRENDIWKNRIIHIKYLQHNMNWNTWGRDSRGTAAMQMNNGKWRIIKALLQRGDETLTGYQVERGITETENCNVRLDSYARHLSRDQQDLLQDLLTKRPVNLVASFKKDGSLLCFSLYTGEAALHFRDIIMNCTDDFTKTVMHTWDNVVGHTNSVLVMMSQGTLWIGEDMQWYNTTALFSEACNNTPILTPQMKIKIYGPALFQRLAGLFTELKGDQKMIIFETICKNRTTDNGIIHNELAVSYEKSSYTLLSATEIYHNDDAPKEYVYVPHYKFSELIVKYGFIEPAYWYVSTTDQMDKLIRDVGDVIYQRSDINGFYQKNPPANKYGYEMVIDFEGFVVYDVIRNNSYSKIKTDEYYNGHKFRENNVELLCELAKYAGHIFPLAAKVKNIYSTIDDAFKTITLGLCDIIDNNTELRENVPEKARGAIVRMAANKAQIYKLIINNCRKKFGELGAEVIYNHYPQLRTLSSESTFDIKSFVVGFAMNNEIWNPDNFVKSVNSDSRNVLIGALINHT